jgi:WD40 repeat protein
VVFSLDGRTLATGSEDDTIRLWEMNVDQVIQRICATTTNTLTPAKWGPVRVAGPALSTALPVMRPAS